MTIFELIRIYNSMRSYFEANYHASLSGIFTLLDDGAASVIDKLVSDNNKKTAERTYEENVAYAVNTFKFRFDTLMESERRRLNADPEYHPDIEPKGKEEQEEEPLYFADKVDSYWFNEALETCYRECLRNDPSLQGIKKETYEEFNIQWRDKIGTYMTSKYSRMNVHYLPELSKDTQAEIARIDMISSWDQKFPAYKKELTKYAEEIDEHEIRESAKATDKLHADVDAFIRKVDVLHTRIRELKSLPEGLRDQKFIDDVEAVSKEAEEILREREELSERTHAALSAAKNEKVLDTAVNAIRTLTDNITAIHTEVDTQLEKYPEDLWLGQLSMDAQQMQMLSSRMLELKQQDLKTNQMIRTDQKRCNDDTRVKINSINDDVSALGSWVRDQRGYVAYRQAEEERNAKVELDADESAMHLRRIRQHRRIREVLECITDTSAYGKHHGVNHPEYAQMLEAVRQYMATANEEMLDHPTPEQKQAMNRAYQACKAYLEVHLKRDRSGKASLGGQSYTVGKLRKQAAVCMYECLIDIGADPAEAEIEPTRAYKKKHITREDLGSLKASLEASAMDYHSDRVGNTVFDEKAYADLEYVRRDHLKIYEKLVNQQRLKNDAKDIKRRDLDEEKVVMAQRLRKTLPKLKMPKNREACMAELEAIRKICEETGYTDYKTFVQPVIKNLMDNYYKVKADPESYTEAMFDQLVYANDEFYMYSVPLRKINNHSVENFKARAEELWAYIQEVKYINQDPKSFHFPAPNNTWDGFVQAYATYLETSQKEKNIPDAKIDIHGNAVIEEKVLQEAVAEEQIVGNEKAAVKDASAKDKQAAPNRNPLHNPLYALVVAGKWSEDNSQLPGSMEQVNKSALSYYNAKAADKQDCLNRLYNTCIDYLEAAQEQTDEAKVCRQAVSGLVQTIYRQRSAVPEFGIAITHYEDAARLSGKEPAVPKVVHIEEAAKKLKELTSSYKDLIRKEGQPAHIRQNVNINKGRMSLPADGGHQPVKGKG